MNRRFFLTGLIAAPIVVKAEWLMPVRRWKTVEREVIGLTDYNRGFFNIGDLISISGHSKFYRVTAISSTAVELVA